MLCCLVDPRFGSILDSCAGTHDSATIAISPTLYASTAEGLVSCSLSPHASAESPNWSPHHKVFAPCPDRRVDRSTIASHSTQLLYGYVVSISGFCHRDRLLRKSPYHEPPFFFILADPSKLATSSPSSASTVEGGVDILIGSPFAGRLRSTSLPPFLSG